MLEGGIQSNPESLEEFRSYLRLLASAQIDSCLAHRVDPSDIVQQTMIQATDQLHRWRGQSRPEMIAWLKQILTRQVIDAARYHRRAKRDMRQVISWEVLARDADQRLNSLCGSCSTPSSRAAKNEDLVRLAAALDQLPEAQRTAVVDHHLHGMPLLAIAEKLGRSEAAVGGLLLRGLRGLHELLREESS